MKGRAANNSTRSPHRDVRSCCFQYVFAELCLEHSTYFCLLLFTLAHFYSSPLYSLAAANIIYSCSYVPTLVSDCYTSKAWRHKTLLSSSKKSFYADEAFSSGITTFRRVFLYFLAAQNIVINLFTCITIYAQCEKPQTLWDPIGTPSKCWPPAVQAVSSTFHRSIFLPNDISTGHWLSPRRCVSAHHFGFHRS